MVPTQNADAVSSQANQPNRKRSSQLPSVDSTVEGKYRRNASRENAERCAASSAGCLMRGLLRLAEQQRHARGLTDRLKTFGQFRIVATRQQRRG